MKIAVVCGSGLGVWRERRKALALLASTDATVVHIAVNAVGVLYPDPLHHWASWHIDQLYERPWRWAEKRRENGLADGYVRWSPSRGGNVDRVLKQWRGGSSGLFGLGVGLDGVGCDGAMLCGVPMDGRENEFTGNPWGEHEKFLAGWEKAWPRIVDRARSMSGWTMDRLGRPTADWLASLREPAGV